MIIVVALALLATAANSSSATLVVSSPFNQLRPQTEWEVRRNSLVRLTEPPDWIESARNVDLILRIQESENAAFAKMVEQGRSTRREWGEAYIEYYYGELSVATERILMERPSRRALSIAVRNAYNPGSDFARLLAKVGSTELDVLVDFSQTPADYQQAKAANLLHLVIADEAAQKRLSTQARVTLANSLIGLTRSRLAFARAEAALGLGYTDSPAAAAALERLEREDFEDSAHGHGSVADIARESLARRRKK